MNQHNSQFPVSRSGLNYAFSNEPLLLNGMKVLFDQQASTYPVNLHSSIKLLPSISQSLSSFSGSLSSYEEAIVIEQATLRKEPKEDSPAWPNKIEPGVRVKIEGISSIDKEGKRQWRNLGKIFSLYSGEFEFLSATVLNADGIGIVEGYIRVDKISRSGDYEASVLEKTLLRKEPRENSLAWPSELNPGTKLRIKGRIIADKEGGFWLGLGKRFHLDNAEAIEFLKITALNDSGEKTALEGYVDASKIFKTTKDFQDWQARAEVEYYKSLQLAKGGGSLLGTGIDTGFEPAMAVLLDIALDTAVDIALIGPFLKLNSWRKTREHIHNLQEILISNKNQRSVENGTVKAILFAIWQKTEKMFKKGLGAIPVVGTLANFWHYGKKLLDMASSKPDGTSKDHALVLWKNANNASIPDSTAIATIKELLGERFGDAAIKSPEGWQMIMGKLDSW